MTGTSVPFFDGTPWVSAELALAALDGNTFLLASEDGGWVHFDEAGSVLASGEDPTVDFYNYGAALTSTGMTTWYVNGDRALAWDGGGFTEVLRVTSGFVPSNGGGATWHAGLLLLSEVDAGGTTLHALDPALGSISTTEWTFPSDRVDAVASTTP